MKVTYAKFYQAISIHDGLTYNTVTFLDADHNPKGDSSLRSGQPITMELMENAAGLIVETPTDNLIITLNNIAYMNVEKPEIKKRAEAANVPKSKQGTATGPIKP